MAALTDFHPYVLPQVPGCPEPTVDLAIRSALIEFCEKTLIVQRDLDPVTVVKGIVDYDIDPPTGQLVTRVLRLWFKDRELTPTAPDNVHNAEVYNTLFSGADKERSDPRMFIQKDERTFTIYPIPKDTVANGLTVRVALKPTRTTETVEDVLFEDYAETIAQGALFRLLSMPSKPWTNGPGASAALTLFTTGINTARQRAARGHTRADVRIRLTGV